MGEVNIADMPIYK